MSGADLVGRILVSRRGEEDGGCSGVALVWSAGSLVFFLLLFFPLLFCLLCILFFFLPRFPIFAASRSPRYPYTCFPRLYKVDEEELLKVRRQAIASAKGGVFSQLLGGIYAV